MHEQGYVKLHSTFFVYSCQFYTGLQALLSTIYSILLSYHKCLKQNQVRKAICLNRYIVATPLAPIVVTILLLNILVVHRGYEDILN